MSLGPGPEPVAFVVPWPGLRARGPRAAPAGVARISPSAPYMVVVREISMDEWMIRDSDGKLLTMKPENMFVF